MQKISIILLAFWYAVYTVGCNNKKFTTDNPDPFCQRFLDSGEAKELRDWLYDGKSTLGVLQTNDKSVKFANVPYRMGAVNIYGFDIDEHPLYGKNTGELCVEMPSDNSTREQLLEWAAPLAWKQGYDAYSDVGQDFIFVRLD